MKILVLNAGSSSQKSCLYELNQDPATLEPPHPLWEAKIDWTRQANRAELKVERGDVVLKESLPATPRTAVMHRLLETLSTGDTQVLNQLAEIDVVGHRVVHGGQAYQQPTRIDADVKATIKDLFALAPVHNPANLEGIELIEEILPEVPQVAVFDTAFHSQLPLAAAVYPGPYEWFEAGIRRYGFHGISHEYCAQRVAQLLHQDSAQLRMITCHLGNGCSLAAVRHGHSVDTTMGFTPLEGLMMGTRSGSVDPGILIHLLRQHTVDVEELNTLLNQKSGLKGISGESGDMRSLMAAINQGNTRAQLAYDMYVHRLRSEMGAMLASLEGLDVIAFTGGIGENSANVRSSACAAFTFLGLQLDEESNALSPKDTDVALPSSPIRVLIIQAQEDWAIARACWAQMVDV